MKTCLFQGSNSLNISCLSQYLIKIVDAFVVKSQLSVLKEILMPLEKAVSGKKSNNMGKIGKTSLKFYDGT